MDRRRHGLAALVLTTAFLLPASAAPELQGRVACAEDSLLRHLEHTSSLALPFCSAYLCLPPVTSTGYYNTITPTSWVQKTSTAHPMILYNLQHLTSNASQITYPTPATPVVVPTSPVECFGIPSSYCRPGLWPRDLGPRTEAPSHHFAPGAATVAAREAGATPAVIQRQTSCPSMPVPTWIAATYPASRVSSACSCLYATNSPTPVQTVYTISTAPSVTATCTAYPTSIPGTWPAYCDPSLYVNLVASPTPVPGAYAETTQRVNSRMDCCGACGGIMNCIYWKFLPSATFPANSNFVSGFDPWAPGTCIVGYNIALVKETAGYDYNLPIVCPNGVGSPMADGKGHNLSPDQYQNLFLNGWNPGPCGGAFNVFESNQECGCDWQNQCE